MLHGEGRAGPVCSKRSSKSSLAATPLQPQGSDKPNSGHILISSKRRPTLTADFDLGPQATANLPKHLPKQCFGPFRVRLQHKKTHKLRAREQSCAVTGTRPTMQPPSKSPEVKKLRPTGKVSVERGYSNTSPLNQRFSHRLPVLAEATSKTQKSHI